MRANRAKLGLTATGLGLLLAVSGGITMASASPNPAITRGRTIVVIQKDTRSQFIDLGDPGPSPGDIVVFASDLFSKDERSQVGDLDIQCINNFDRRAVCVGIFTLAGKGQISVDALPRFPEAVEGIVTGGNGLFSNARGEADIRPLDQERTKITFHLIP